MRSGAAARLEALLTKPIADERARLGEATAVLDGLEQAGAVTAAERLALWRDWMMAYGRNRVQHFFCHGNAAEAAAWGDFVRTGFG
jgi:hypothetical protein